MPILLIDSAHYDSHLVVNIKLLALYSITNDFHLNFAQKESTLSNKVRITTKNTINPSCTPPRGNQTLKP